MPRRTRRANVPLVPPGSGVGATGQIVLHPPPNAELGLQNAGLALQ
jgi:hypothetical protein